jgi:ABC-type phosphate/phosphonate transport system substrate-binding protein
MFRFGGALLSASMAVAVMAADPPQPIRIGLLKALVRETPRERLNVLEQQFREVMKAQTGLDGEIRVVDTADDVARSLADGGLQFAAFSGLGFAWLKPVQPKLAPLMIGVTDPDSRKAVIVVARDAAAPDLKALRGGKLALPGAATEDARQFLRCACLKAGVTVRDCFPATTNPESVEDAMDDVVDRAADAALVDRAAMKMYERRKPARFAKLRVLLESDPLPPGILAYRTDKLDPATVERIRAGLANAHQSDAGRRLVNQMRIQRFEPAPPDLLDVLSAAARQFPPPG